MTIAAIVMLVVFGQASGVSQAQVPGKTVSGQVADGTGLPLPGAVISVRGATALAVTDEAGRFILVTAAGAGSTVLVVAMSGFETKEVTVTGDVPIRVVLELAKVSSEVTVRAPIADTIPDARLVLRPLDVVRTAGTQADLMRAVALMPGVSQVDEGAGLFVRGGDVSETRVLLDGAVINHPYRYETPTGGFRGSVDPFLTQGISFSTGGFSAEYANSLSGVIDMQGLGRPATSRESANAGLAGVSGSVAVPVGDRAGLRIAANRTTPGVLFAVNPSPTEFDILPHGWDASASAHLDLDRYGSLRVFASQQRDGVGVELQQDAFAGFLHASTDHRLVVADWRKPLRGTWAASAVLGVDRYTNGTDVGVMAIDVVDTERSLRLDMSGAAGLWRVRAGADAELTSAMVIGRVPTRGGDFGGVSGASPFEVAHDDMRAGAYGEISRSFGRVTPTVGVRTDRYDHAGVWRTDPRVNIAIETGHRSRIRLAWGVYHQSPSARYFDDARGENALGPMAATHYIVGYDVGQITDAFFFRAEAYVKTYRDLPVDNGLEGFAGNGYGHARGVDLFARRVWHFVDLRASMSLVDAARRWTSPDQRDRYPVPAGTWTPDFDIPYTGQINVTAPVWKTVSVGVSWRVAAGRPFTPVAGAIPVAGGFEPVWGPINSERVPRYQRLDWSISHTRTLGTRGMAVFYASVDNATNRSNFFEYAYSADYQVRRPVPGALPRSLYVGCSITR